MNGNDKYEALSKIKGLLDSGVLTEEEFNIEKERILSQTQIGTNAKYDGTESRFSNNSEDKPSVGLDIISFLTGIGGVIIYFVTRDNYPIRAKSNLKWGLIGISVSVVFELLLISLFSVL